VDIWADFKMNVVPYLKRLHAASSSLVVAFSSA